MVAEAERNRGEDEALREEVDARNELDSAAYQVERRLAELGDSAPPHEKARAEMLVADARQAVQDGATRGGSATHLGAAAAALRTCAGPVGRRPQQAALMLRRRMTTT